MSMFYIIKLIVIIENILYTVLHYNNFLYRYFALQRRNPSVIMKLPETQNNIDIATNEPVVGGVYLRLFIASPAWALRKPKEFLSELMDTILTLMSKEKTDVSVAK